MTDQPPTTTELLETIDDLAFSQAEATAQLAVKLGPYQITTGDADRHAADVFLLPEGYKTHVVQAKELNFDHPIRKQGTTIFTKVGSLATYLEHQSETPTIYADPAKGTITAVFNDHRDDRPGWQDYQAVYRATATPEWTAWRTQNGQYSEAAEFAEFLEDWRHTIADPATADLVQLIRSFKATTAVEYENKVDDANGDTTLHYVSTTTQQPVQGQISIPDHLTLAIAPYQGLHTGAVTARLRYRLSRGKATFGITLEQAQKISADLFDAQVEWFADKTGMDVLFGKIQ